MSDIKQLRDSQLRKMAVFVAEELARNGGISVNFMPIEADPYLTVAQVSNFIGFNEDWVLERIKCMKKRNGKWLPCELHELSIPAPIPAIMADGRFRCRKSAFDAWRRNWEALNRI